MLTDFVVYMEFADRRFNIMIVDVPTTQNAYVIESVITMFRIIHKFINYSVVRDWCTDEWLRCWWLHINHPHRIISSFINVSV